MQSNLAISYFSRDYFLYAEKGNEVICSFHNYLERVLSFSLSI